MQASGIAKVTRGRSGCILGSSVFRSNGRGYHFVREATCHVNSSVIGVAFPPWLRETMLRSVAADCVLRYGNTRRAQTIPPAEGGSAITEVMKSGIR